MTDKRKIDFAERRLHEFYAPASYALAGIMLALEEANPEELKNYFSRLSDLHCRFNYFATQEIRTVMTEFINKFQPYIEKGDLDKLKKDLDDSRFQNM